MQAIMEPEAVPETTKKCPFCAESIQAAAIKCRYCGEFLSGRPRFQSSAGKTGKWFHSTSVVVLALLTLGPLALPLVWVNPRYSVINKAIVTVGVILLTVMLCYAMGMAYRSLMAQIHSLGM